MTGDPFRALGLPAGPDLTDDDVRAAWRRVAAATHPDRADGGDPAAFAAAAAAYSDLRTRFGRGEVLAERTARGRGASRAGARSWPARVLGALAAGSVARVRRGRPGRLALRVLGAAAMSAVVVAVAGWQPATLALITGPLTWLIRSGRHDLAAPRAVSPAPDPSPPGARRP